MPGEVMDCYRGPEGTNGVGACRAGQQTCLAGTWGACQGEVTPQTAEVAGDLIDDDCNGTALIGESSLVVRYFINEDPAQDPTEIHDASDVSLNLTLLNPDPPVLSVAQDEQGHRGLRWTTAGQPAVAKAEIMDTQIHQKLNGKTATFELVMDLSYVLYYTRPIYIGHWDSSTTFDDLSIAFGSTGFLHLRFADVDAGRWDLDLAQDIRMVLHVVVNTAESTEEARRRLYINGQFIASSAYAAVLAKDKAIDLSMSTHLSLGTRPTSDTSPAGMVYYAAIYNAALSDDEIQTNAALLLLDDDHP
jgi:hypothetical protein